MRKRLPLERGLAGWAAEKKKDTSREKVKSAKERRSGKVPRRKRERVPRGGGEKRESELERRKQNFRGKKKKTTLHVREKRDVRERPAETSKGRGTEAQLQPSSRGKKRKRKASDSSRGGAREGSTEAIFTEKDMGEIWGGKGMTKYVSERKI